MRWQRRTSARIIGAPVLFIDVSRWKHKSGVSWRDRKRISYVINNSIRLRTWKWNIIGYWHIWEPEGRLWNGWTPCCNCWWRSWSHHSRKAKVRVSWREHSPCPVLHPGSYSGNNNPKLELWCSLLIPEGKVFVYTENWLILCDLSDVACGFESLAFIPHTEDKSLRVGLACIIKLFITGLSGTSLSINL
jgi:hypothetical protein